VFVARVRPSTGTSHERDRPYGVLEYRSIGSKTHYSTTPVLQLSPLHKPFAKNKRRLDAAVGEKKIAVELRQVVSVARHSLALLGFVPIRNCPEVLFLSTRAAFSVFPAKRFNTIPACYLRARVKQVRERNYSGLV